MIAHLKLEPHPEGGYFRETFRDVSAIRNERHPTAVPPSAQGRQGTRWHIAVTLRRRGTGMGRAAAPRSDARRDAARISTWLRLARRRAPTRPRRRGGSPRRAPPASGGRSTGCTVAPGFDFEGSELAPDDRQPRRGFPGIRLEDRSNSPSSPLRGGRRATEFALPLRCCLSAVARRVGETPPAQPPPPLMWRFRHLHLPQGRHGACCCARSIQTVARFASPT